MVEPVVIPTTLLDLGCPRDRLSGSPTVTKKFVGPASGSVPMATYASLPMATILILSVLCAKALDFADVPDVLIEKLGLPD